jgi:hypothetical protein
LGGGCSGRSGGFWPGRDRIRRAPGGTEQDRAAGFVDGEDLFEGGGREVDGAGVLAVALAMQGRQPALAQLDLEADGVRQAGDHHMDRAEQAGGVRVGDRAVRIDDDLGIEAGAGVATQARRTGGDLGAQVRHAVAHLPDHGVHDGAFEGRQVGHGAAITGQGKVDDRKLSPQRRSDRSSGAAVLEGKAARPIQIRS